jgi:hypothetical protein
MGTCPQGPANAPAQTGADHSKHHTCFEPRMNVMLPAHQDTAERPAPDVQYIRRIHVYPKNHFEGRQGTIPSCFVLRLN